MPMLPYHQPRTGLEAKYSIEYDMAAIALDGKAGLHQYSDQAVNRPAAQELLTRVRYVPVEGDLHEIKLESQVVLTLKDGTRLEESAHQSHGNPQDPLTEAEVAAKFHECAEGSVSAAQRDAIIDLCYRLDTLASVRVLGDAVGSSAE
jgi:2-methylcitrate dehydratase PrpD